MQPKIVLYLRSSFENCANCLSPCLVKNYLPGNMFLTLYTLILTIVSILPPFLLRIYDNCKYCAVTWSALVMSLYVVFFLLSQNSDSDLFHTPLPVTSFHMAIIIRCI